MSLLLISVAALLPRTTLQLVLWDTQFISESFGESIKKISQQQYNYMYIESSLKIMFHICRPHASMQMALS